MKKLLMVLGVVGSLMAAEYSCSLGAVQIDNKGVIPLNSKTEPLIKKSLGGLFKLKLKGDTNKISARFENNVTADFVYLNGTEGVRKYLATTKDSILLVDKNDSKKVALAFKIKDKNQSALMVLFYKCQ